MSEDKKEINLNESQLKAVNADTNSVVSAGAGSGKTTVLAQRFTRLVLEKNYKVDEILTLTFTKKATVEMSDRIYKTLAKSAPEQASEFYKANIKTLDSYCNSVAKIGAHLYGISPDFVQDDSIVTQIQQMALPFILEHRSNNSIKELVKTKSFDVIASELFAGPVLKDSTVTNPIDFDNCLLRQVEEILSAYNKSSKSAEYLLSVISSEFETWKGTPKKFIEDLTEILEDEIPGRPELTYNQITSGFYESIQVYVNFIQKIAGLRLPTFKGAEVLKETITNLRVEVGTLISILNFISGYNIMKDLLPLLKEFQDKANNLKRSTGKLTFKDISSMATTILLNHPEIRQLEKEKYKAIMIDEFQDNNQDQRDMLFMLAERLDRCSTGVPEVADLCPDKLFFVGDEKQSIYKFRGADVSVFRALSKDFSEGNLSMSTNHRSNQALIAAFNSIFGGIPYPTQSEENLPLPSVFFTEADEKENGVPDYEPVYHEVTLTYEARAEAEKNPGVYAPKVHFATYDTAQEADINELVEAEAEAEWVAQKIDTLIKEQNFKPEDIAILIRSYSCQPLYERTLLSHGIPYNSETLTGFFSDGPVNDIFALLRICIYKYDSLSYAQFLRSPFVNLTTEEVSSILIANKEPFMSDGKAILCEESARRYNHAKEFYEELKDLSKTESLTSLITKIWYEAGYRYETMWNETVQLYGKLYDYIFELARQAETDNMSLAAFVDSMRTYQDLTEKLEGMDIPLEASAGVHILTIHKSKGLEYPVVFLVNTQGGSVNNTNASPIYSSKEFGITINTPPLPEYGEKTFNYFYNIMKEEESAKASAELRRLVYVALTRAKSELYITNGKYSEDLSANEKYAPGEKVRSIFDVLEPIFNHFAEVPEKESPFTYEKISPMPRHYGTPADKYANTEGSKKLFVNNISSLSVYESDQLLKMETVESKYIKPSLLHDESDANPTTHSEEEYLKVPYAEVYEIVKNSIPKGSSDGKPRFLITDFGTLAHACIEAALNKVDFKPSERNLLGLEGNKKAIEKIVLICNEMKANFEKTELGQRAINSVFHKAEYNFRSRIGNKIVKGQIDLLFQDKNGKFVIVDHKTDGFIEPENHIEQISLYRHAVSQMLGIKNPSDIECYLYYLRYHKAVDISSACDQIDILSNITNICN